MRAVADIALGSGPSQIDRYDRARQVSVEGNLLRGTTLGEASAAVKQLPAMNPLPPGVEQESSGDAKVMMDVFSGFAGALGTAVLLIYAVLVLLFANFLHPVTIMAALPLSVGGALLGLLVGQKSLGLYALIGIVLLMGIVTKNSILLVDYAILNGDAGFGGGALAADFDDDDRHDCWDGPHRPGTGRRFSGAEPDGDGGNWRFDDFYAVDSGGDSGDFYLYGWFPNLDFRCHFESGAGRW